MEVHRHSRGNVHRLMGDHPPRRVTRTICMGAHHHSNAHHHHRMVTFPRGVPHKEWLHMEISEVEGHHPRKDSSGRDHHLQ